MTCGNEDDETALMMQQETGSSYQPEDQTPHNKLADSEEGSGGTLDLVNTRGSQQMGSSMLNIVINPPTTIDTPSTSGVPIISMTFGAY